MYTIWFEVEGLIQNFTGGINAARTVYDALKASGVQMKCARP